MDNNRIYDGLDKETFGDEYKSNRYRNDTVDLGKTNQNQYGQNTMYNQNNAYNIGMITTEDKAIATISYIGLLWLIPLIMKDRSKYVTEHANSAINIWLASLVFSLVYTIGMLIVAIPFIICLESEVLIPSLIFGLILLVLGIGSWFFAFAIWINCIVNFIFAIIGKEPTRWFLKNTNLVK